MLVDIMGWIYGLGYIVTIVHIVLWNLGHLYKAVKCRKTEECCCECACRYNICCKKYREVPTEKDIQELDDMLAFLEKIKMTA